MYKLALQLRNARGGIRSVQEYFRQERDYDEDIRETSLCINILLDFTGTLFYIFIDDGTCYLNLPLLASQYVNIGNSSTRMPSLDLYP